MPGLDGDAAAFDGDELPGFDGNELAAFNGNDYRKRVLAAIEGRGGPEFTDPFEAYDLPVESLSLLTDAAVVSRLDAVWAFWQKQRDHPKYRGLVTALLGEHAEWSAQLSTAAARERMAARVVAAREERDAGRFAAVDDAVKRLVRRFGGVPRGKVAGLAALAASEGIGDAEFQRRLRRHRLVDDVAPVVVPRAPDLTSVYRQVRADLDELGRIGAAAPPTTLYELIELPPGADPRRVLSQRDLLSARNRERRPDRRRALMDDLLAAVTSLLVNGDPHAYLDFVATEVKARLRPKAAGVILVEDELTEADAATLVLAAEADGLDSARALRLVAELAHENGVAAPVMPDPGWPGAGAGSSGSGLGSGSGPGSGSGSRAGSGAGAGSGSGSEQRPDRPAPPPRPDRGRNPFSGSGAGAGATGAGASRATAASGTASGNGPGTGSGSAVAWQEALSRARAAIRSGKLLVARAEVLTARQVSGELLPPIRALQDEVESLLADAAQRWRLIEEALSGRRWAAAVSALEEQVAKAKDVPSSAGRTAGAVLSRTRRRLTEDSRLADALMKGGSANELELLVILKMTPEHSGARRCAREDSGRSRHGGACDAGARWGGGQLAEVDLDRSGAVSGRPARSGR